MENKHIISERLLNINLFKSLRFYFILSKANENLSSMHINVLYTRDMLHTIHHKPVNDLSLNLQQNHI